MSLDDHKPFNRVIMDETTSCDRQWLAMLEESFRDIDYDTFIMSGFPPKAATALLGLVACCERAQYDA